MRVHVRENGLRRLAADRRRYKGLLSAAGSKRRPTDAGPGFMPLQVIVNFGKGGRFGCRGRCPFCEWEVRWDWLPSERLIPTDGELAAALDGYEGFTLTVSGGGDPLYGLGEESMGHLTRISAAARSRGILPELITREWRRIAEVEHLFDMYCVSSQGFDGRLAERISELRASGKYVRVSYVLPESPSEEDVAAAEAWCREWSSHVDRADVRENFNGDKNPPWVRRRIMSASWNANYISKGQCDRLRCIMGGKVTTGLRFLRETRAEELLRSIRPEDAEHVCVYGSASLSEFPHDVDLAYDSHRWAARKDFPRYIREEAVRIFGGVKVNVKATARLSEFYLLQTLHSRCVAQYSDGIRKSEGRRAWESGDRTA